MRHRLFCTVATLAIVALAAAAAPAFTSDNQTLTLNVTAQAPPTPCVTFATTPGTQVDFGTRAYSRPGNLSLSTGSVRPVFSNCGTADENLLIAGTDAHNVCPTLCLLHTWSLQQTTDTCAGNQTNVYALYWSVDNHGSNVIGTTNTRIYHPDLGPSAVTWVAGEQHALGLELEMPCQGSDGAGESFAMNVSLTAAIA